MAEQCNNCGNDIFAGQRFCRSCGSPTGLVSEEAIPTQMMPSNSASTGPRGPATTAPSARPETSPVYGPPQAYYQPPVAQRPMPPYVPPRSHSPWKWILSVVGIGMFAVIVLAIFMIMRQARNHVNREQTSSQRREVVAGPRIGEEGASITDRETTVTRTFTLGNSAKVSLENMSGNVSVQGWDQPTAEVKVIKRGGSSRDRSNVDVGYSNDGGNLSLRAGPMRGRGVEVEYIVKVPRKLGRLEVKGVSSDVKLSGLDGSVAVETASGDIELKGLSGEISIQSASGSIEVSEITGNIEASSRSGDIDITGVSGTASASTASGNIEVDFKKTTPGKPLKFESASGDIELKFMSSLDADFSAETRSGSIDIDDSFGIQVESQQAGSQAAGRIGKGGLPLSVETASGSIKVMK